MSFKNLLLTMFLGLLFFAAPTAADELGTGTPGAAAATSNSTEAPDSFWEMLLLLADED